MYKLVRIINQNRKQILIAILAIVFVIILIQILNSVSKKNNEEKLKELQNSASNYISSAYDPSHSVISGGSVNEKNQTEVEEVIEQFITACNNGEIQNAYELLSTNCKEQIYPTLEKFKQTYYIQNFNTKKQYSIQSWTSGKLIYKVELYEDVLSMGKVEADNSIQDFFTIVKEEGQTKLNISEYIGKSVINKELTKQGITVKVNYKNIYKDYEVYNITIENLTENSILLNSNESTKTIYLKGQNGATYTAYIYEISANIIELKNYNRVTTNIKFNKQYSTSNSVTSIVFEDIILNSEEYKNMKNKLEYENRVKIEIDI